MQPAPSPSLAEALTDLLAAQLEALSHRNPAYERQVADLACGTGDQLFRLAQAVATPATYWGLTDQEEALHAALCESTRLRLSDRCLFLPRRASNAARLPRLHLAFAVLNGPPRLSVMEQYLAQAAHHLHAEGRLVLVSEAPQAEPLLTQEALARLAHLHGLHVTQTRFQAVPPQKSTKNRLKNWISGRAALLFPKKKPDFEERVCLSTEVPGYYTVVIEKEAT